MSLSDAAARARHDLGKYVAFQVRWVGADAPAEELRAALREDLLHTRKAPDGVTPAVELWRELRVPLVEAGIERVDALVAELEVAASRLDALDEPGLRRAAAAAIEVGEELRALHRRVGA